MYFSFKLDVLCIECYSINIFNNIYFEKDYFDIIQFFMIWRHKKLYILNSAITALSLYYFVRIMYLKPSFSSCARIKRPKWCLKPFDNWNPSSDLSSKRLFSTLISFNGTQPWSSFVLPVTYLGFIQRPLYITLHRIFNPGQT